MVSWSALSIVLSLRNGKGRTHRPKLQTTEKTPNLLHRTAEDAMTPLGFKHPFHIFTAPPRNPRTTPPSPASSSLVGTEPWQPHPSPPFPSSPPLSFLGFPPDPTQTSMAKTKQGKRDIDSYTIRGTTKVVRVGDCVLMRPSDTDNAPYVARVESLESDGRGSVRVRVRWYYRPEESKGGRRQFHGAKELFLSDHFDTQSAHTIEGKCIVHSFKNYTKLDNVGPEDFFCRFEYKAATGAFTPDRVAVYCKCEMPYNPDDLMVQCEGCKDWFHPTCMGMTIEQAKKLDTFLCADCAKENGAKRPSNSYPSSPSSDSKVEPKRRKK